MNFIGMMEIGLIIAANNQAQERVTISDALATPPVIAAMRHAWSQARAGALGIEAAFRLDGNWSEYTITVAPITHEFMKQAISIVPGATFAVFHVHPMRRPGAPSDADQHFANKYRFKMYTLHASGLYEYDPVTRKTSRLHKGVQWLKSPENRKAQANQSSQQRLFRAGSISE